MNPRFGYLCLFENPTSESGRALTRQAILAREAERMRYDDIWIAEQHFDDALPSGAITALLGYLAGVTLRARIGSAALLTPFRDPVQVAEDIASIDLLTKARFNFGVSAGGPFPLQNGHFGVSREEAQARSLEALELIGRLLSEEEVSHEGKHFKVDKLRLAPRPAQPIPTWIATTTESTIRHAAQKGYGLIASATCTRERLREMFAIYRDEAPEGDPRLVLARFGFTGGKREDALAVAQPYFEDFCTRMRARRESLAESGAEGAKPESGELDPQMLLDMSLVGSYDEVAEHVNQLNQEFGVHGLAIIPTSAQFDTVKRCLAEFVDEIRLRLPVD